MDVLKKINVRQIQKGTLRTACSVARIVILLSIGFIIIYPLLYMIVCSVQSRDAFFDSTRVWIPTQFSIVENYKIAFGVMSYAKSFFATFKYAIVIAFIEVAMCAIIAYGFARFEFKEKKFYLALLLVTILIPDMMLLIPRMVNFSLLNCSWIKLSIVRFSRKKSFAVVIKFISGANS